LIAALVTLFILRASYQPTITSEISFVRVLNANGAVVPAIKNGDSVNSPDPQVWLEPRGEFTVEIIATLHNEGDIGVSLDSVKSPNLSAPHLPYFVFFSGGGNNDWGSFGKFHPATIPAHGNINIGIRYSEECLPGSNSYISNQSLSTGYSFLGVHHTAIVPVQPYRLKLRTSC